MSVRPAVEDLYPLSPMQEGLLFHSLESPGSGIHVTQHTWLLDRLDVDAFKRAWQWAVDEHGVLRTAFVWKRTSKPFQAVMRGVTLSFVQEDWRGCSGDEMARRVDSYMAAERRRDFELNQPPLLRLAIMTLDEQRHRVLLTQHHILLDGWSLPLLWGDVVGAYGHFVRGSIPRSPGRRPFRDYIAWLQQQDRGDAERFWSDVLVGYAGGSGFSALDSVPSISGHPRSENVLIRAADVQRLAEWCRSHQITLNTACQGALGLTLAKVRSRDDLVFGAVVSGRPGDLPDVDGMLGLLINTIPIRIRVSPDEPLAAWIRAVQFQHLEASQYAYLPLTEIKRCSRVSPREPLFDVVMNFLNYPRPRADAADDPALPIVAEADYSTSNNYRLSVLVGAKGEDLSITLLADPQYVSPLTSQRIGLLFKASLEAFAASGSGTRLSDIRRRLDELSTRLTLSERTTNFREFRSVSRKSPPVPPGVGPS